MARWEDTLPASIQLLLDVKDEELGDYAETIRKQTIISRLAYKRAVEGVALGEYNTQEIVEMGDSTEPPDNAQVLKDRDITARLELATKANKALVDIKTARLDAIEKFKDKASDTPKPANITFHRTETSPSLLVRRLLILGRTAEARTVAKDNGLDWAQFENHSQVESVES
jgi:hypothetical protein